MTKRITTHALLQMKAAGQRIVALTAYDYPTAVAVDQAGVDLILVGDSLASVVLGLGNTLPVTMDEMVHHAKAVARGVRRAFVVADLPFLADVTPEEAVRNGGRFLKEAGASAVKLEGGHEPQIAAVRALIQHGIPVVAHLGFTPQHLHQLGGFRIQGKTEEAAAELLRQARALEAAGACALVLELVPEAVSERLTRELGIPTIGIGAGEACDGQIQVFHDLLGLHVDHRPKHARRYAEIHEVMVDALQRYGEDVRAGRFVSSEPLYGAGNKA